MSTPQRDAFVPGIAHPVSPRAPLSTEEISSHRDWASADVIRVVNLSKSSAFVQEEDEEGMHQMITVFFQDFVQDELAENGRFQHSVLIKSCYLKDDKVQGNHSPT